MTTEGYYLHNIIYSKYIYKKIFFGNVFLYSAERLSQWPFLLLSLSADFKKAAIENKNDLLIQIQF